MTKHLVRLAVFLVTMVAARSWAITFETIHTFAADGSEGTGAEATLTIGPDHALYGTAFAGGAGDFGTAFKISTGGTFTPLGSFDVAVTGKNPRARLVNIGDGFLYGATSAGTGTAGEPLGTVFKLDPAGGLTPIFALPGSGTTPMRPFSLTSGEENVLHVLGNSPGGIWRVPLDGGTRTVPFTFAPSGDEGQGPQRIIRGSDGNFYGVTKGTTYVAGLPNRRGSIFRVAPNGTGFTTLHDCESATGMEPYGAMVEGPDGAFYGTMHAGGVNGDGVIYRITTAGEYTVLYSINDHPPKGDLMLASDGKLYGTSERGGAGLGGSIFRINTNGTGFEVVYTFNRVGANSYPNGSLPVGGLVQADDGKLYGVTSTGGSTDKGTIFRIDLGLEPPPVNRAPVAIDDYGFSSGSETVLPVRANDFDPDDELETLTVTIETQPQHGTASLEVGGQIRYTPGPTYAGSDVFTYRITDPHGQFAIGTVHISNDALPMPWQAGVYNGILNLDPNLEGDTHTPRGQLIINIAASGAFTGKLITGKKQLTVRGIFGDGDTAIAFVKIPKKETAIVFLAPSAEGSLSVFFFGQEQWTGYISRLPLENPPPKAKYTIALRSKLGNLPIGSGYGIARVLSNGLVAAVGKLGDGSKFSWGTSFVIVEGTLGIPVFNEPTKGGVCAGRFFPGTLTTFQADPIRWIRPSVAKPKVPYPLGFSGDLYGFMDLYVPPARGELPLDFGIDQLGQVEVFGPSANPSIEALAAVNGTRLVPNNDANNPLKSLSISRANGLFSGKIKIGTKTVPFKGAVLQSIKRGWGYYTIDKVTGDAALVSD
ncbi:choice-of-anchor tandem repeat GloVer-containing protein [Verrucomicrobiota bacterium sgz303538]